MGERPLTRKELDERYARGELSDSQYGRLLLQIGASDYQTDGAAHPSAPPRKKPGGWRPRPPSAAPAPAQRGNPAAVAMIIGMTLVTLTAGLVMYFAAARTAVEPADVTPAVEPATPEAVKAPAPPAPAENPPPEAAKTPASEAAKTPPPSEPAQTPPPATPAIAVETAPFKPPATSDGLDYNTINRVVRSHLGAVRTCYERHLKAQPGLSGSVRATFTIGPDGAVAACRTERDTFSTPAVAQCICEQVRRWRFPRSGAGKSIDVTYPFVFTAK